MTAFFAKIISFFMTVIMFLFPWANIPENKAETDAWNTDYTCVFVHGLGGWGEYDAQNALVPYWGTLGGDCIKYLNARGFDCAAASVDPSGSAWDRACELYAQLTGTVVDYGAEHSERCNHERFGKDYSCHPLISEFDAEHKINLFGHSFGGATILMLLDLLADGSEAEKAATPANELSALFEGGKADWVYSVTCLAAPMNGTTAVNCKDVIEADPNATAADKTVVTMLTGIGYKRSDDRIIEDTAGWDMDIDVAMAMLDTFETQPDVYYFSLPTCSTETVDGVTSQIPGLTESIYAAAGARMSVFTGETKNGYVIDESWQPNDGLVNVKSARAPFNAPQKDIDMDDIQPGIWNIYPTREGDHMSLMGGMLINTPVRDLYADMINTINTLG